MDENKNKDIPFEEAIKRLEALVKELEGGSAPLDESLKLFEEGVRLVSSCKEQLDKAEQRVRFLMENGSDGDIKHTEG